MSTDASESSTATADKRSPLIFLDTETTGLALDDDIWEIAVIKRYPDGYEETWLFQVEHDSDRCAKLPDSFREDHRRRYNDGSAPVITAKQLAEFCANVTEDRPHVVGAVPNFDTERLSRLCEQHGEKWGGHYHLIDVENLAVGFLAGVCRLGGAAADQSCSWLTGPPAPPWDSDSLSRACGVEPPTTTRHTAMGDVLWGRALYDAITGKGATPVGSAPKEASDV